MLVQKYVHLKSLEIIINVLFYITFMKGCYAKDIVNNDS